MRLIYSNSSAFYSFNTLSNWFYTWVILSSSRDSNLLDNICITWLIFSGDGYYDDYILDWLSSVYDCICFILYSKSYSSFSKSNLLLIFESLDSVLYLLKEGDLISSLQDYSLFSNCYINWCVFVKRYCLYSSSSESKSDIYFVILLISYYTIVKT